MTKKYLTGKIAWRGREDGSVGLRVEEREEDRGIFAPHIEATLSWRWATLDDLEAVGITIAVLRHADMTLPALPSAGE